MRYLLIALLLTITTASAQNVNDKPAPDSKPQTPGAAAPAPAATAPANATQQAGGIDQKFIDAAIKAAGSKEAAARIEITRGWKQLKQGDVEKIVEEGVQEGLKRFMERVGIDDIPAFRKDLTAMRAARETREALISHGLKAVVTVLLGGIGTAIWLAIKGAK